MGLLRFLLAFAVLLQHSAPLCGLRMTGGIVAVQAFFIISGFYMTLILEEKYAHVARPYALFMGNRLLRLFPAYLAVVALTIAAYFVVKWTTGLALGTPWGGLPAWAQYSRGMSAGTRAWLVLTNLGLVGQDWTLFTFYDARHGLLHFATHPFQKSIPSYRFLLVPQAWTLGLELTFYCLAPYLVRRRWWLVALLVAASLGLRAYDHDTLHLSFDPWIYRFFPQELALFLAGCLGCKAYRTYLAGRGRDLRWAGGAALAALVGATLCYWQVAWEGRHVAYLAAMALAMPLIFALTQKWRWDRALGELSYPMYIGHVFFVPYELAFVGKYPWLSKPMLLIPATIALAVALHWFIERPVDRLRQRRVVREAQPEGAAA